MSSCKTAFGINNPPRAVDIARLFIGEILQAGDTAVDATAGNGNDTLFLARAVGNTGKVYSFDIQQAALDETRTRLQRKGLAERVYLLADSHENMLKSVERDCCTAVMFNLGYLPGGNKDVKTLPEATLAAVKAALSVLAPGGRMSIVAYRGHPGGNDEFLLLKEFIASLDSRLYWTAQFSFLNRIALSPRAILLQKGADFIQ